MQTHVLKDFPQAIKHNFFSDLAQQFRTGCPEADSTHPDHLSFLQQELEQLHSERNYLRKAIDMLGRKANSHQSLAARKNCPLIIAD